MTYILFYFYYLADTRRNPTGMLAKQLRLKLTGDGNDIPRAYQNLIVSVHAVATFKAIDEYLRPRISRTSLESRDKLRAGISRRQRRNKEAGATESTTSQTSEKLDASSVLDEASDTTSKDVASDEKQVPVNDSIESSDVGVSRSGKFFIGFVMTCLLTFNTPAALYRT
jgi:E3 ubiquitin-protein ligase TRIP12